MRPVKNQHWHYKIRLLALAALLVLSQFALAQHEADLAKHVAGTHCGWCIAGNSLHAAVGSQGWLPLSPHLQHLDLAQATHLADLFFAPVYLSRAPPTLSYR